MYLERKYSMHFECNELGYFIVTGNIVFLSCNMLEGLLSEKPEIHKIPQNIIKNNINAKKNVIK